MTVPPVVFGDTSYYIALLSRPDADRQRAISWQRHVARERLRVVTTEAVLWELLNFFSARGRERAIQGYRRLHSDPRVEVVPFDAHSCDTAVRLYEQRPDQHWGVTDCLSFEVMRQRGLTAALTFDHDFEQAGFTALLLRDPSQ